MATAVQQQPFIEQHVQLKTQSEHISLSSTHNQGIA